MASQNQYLRVQRKDGRVEHIPGPKSLFMNPVKHEQVSVEDAEVLDATEVLMLYTEGSVDSTKLVPRVIQGPAVFVPSANERLLSFTWVEEEEMQTENA